MAEPFMAEIKITAFGFAPKGWALCNGQVMPVNQNQALASLLKNFYGGDGQTTFGLPDFRGRAPMHVGEGLTLGKAGGEELHTLVTGELPTHTHQVNASSAPGTTNLPSGNVLANSNVSPYRTDSNTSFNPALIENAGQSQPHENRQPYLALNFVIALQGAFPSQS
jgi:microcystin-dependent protein